MKATLSNSALGTVERGGRRYDETAPCHETGALVGNRQIFAIGQYPKAFAPDHFAARPAHHLYRCLIGLSKEYRSAVNRSHHLSSVIRDGL
jgi:hypothetical protein